MQKRLFQKSIFISLIFFLFSVSLNAKDLCIQLKPFAGIENSCIEEAYYYERKSSSDEYKLMSLLEWEQSPSYYAGLEGSIGYKNTFLKIKGDYKLPLYCGKMLDSDYTEDGLKFNYSVNENTIQNAFDLSASISHSFNLKYFTFEPELSADWSFIIIQARDGHGWYGSAAYTSDGQTHKWSDSEAHYFPDGKVHLAGVDYKNHTICLFTGINISKVFFEKWENSIGLFVSPFIYIYAKDSHVGKVNYFTTEDYIYNYFRNFKINYKTGLKVSENAVVQILAQYECCFLTQGEDYYDNYKNRNDGGASYKKFRIEAGFKYSIKK